MIRKGENKLQKTTNPKTEINKYVAKALAKKALNEILKKKPNTEPEPNTTGGKPYEW